MIDFNQKNTAGGNLTDDEMLSNLKRLRESADSKYRNFNTTKIVSGNRVKNSKIETMNQLFDLLESNNIDPSNKEQLNNFMEGLKSYSPEIFAMFEKALGELVADPDAQLPDEQEMPQEGMQMGAEQAPEEMEEGLSE